MRFTSCISLLCSLLSVFLCQGLPQPLPGTRQDAGSPSHLVYHLPCRLAHYSIIHPADLPHASLTEYISDDDSSGVPCSPVAWFPSPSRFHPWASPPHHLPQLSCSPGSFLPPPFCSLPRPPSPLHCFEAQHVGSAHTASSWQPYPTCQQAGLPSLILALVTVYEPITCFLPAPPVCTTPGQG